MQTPHIIRNIRNRRRAGQGGQVLAFALIAMIAVLIAVVFLFDLNTVIRGKVKGQNAVDAAALAGATWQMHTLNLIGELNLIKATSVLTSGTQFGLTELGDEEAGLGPAQFRPAADYLKTDGSVDKDKLIEDVLRVEDERERIVETVDLLTQLQTRVSFVLPLIGYGAAQQAAKNNGITRNQDGCEVVFDLLNNLYDNTLYGNPDVVAQEINGYSWREPYANMIQMILSSGKGAVWNADDATGIAVGTGFQGLGCPGALTHTTSALGHFVTSRAFYLAVNSNSWCDLRHILGKDFSGAWWGSFDVSYYDNFSGESEILPVNVDFFAGSPSYSNLPATFPKRYGDSGTETPLDRLYDDKEPYPYTCTIQGSNMIIDFNLFYDSDGRLIPNPADTDLNSNILPEFTWCTYNGSWSKYDSDTLSFWKQYLRSSFREGYDYFSGAIAWFDMEQDTVTMTGDLSATGDSSKRIGNAFTFKDRRGQQGMVTAENNLAGGVHPIRTDASAKPFGRIKIGENGQYKPPFEAGNMVLPVFTEVALMPVELEGHSGISQLDRDWIIYLTKFLPILGASHTVDEAVTTFKAEYPGDYSRISWYVQALTKVQDENWHKQGLDWLEQPARWRYETVQSFNTKTGKTEDKTVKVVTKYNKDLCDEWPSGGTSGGRSGPGRLH